MANPVVLDASDYLKFVELVEYAISKLPNDKGYLQEELDRIQDHVSSSLNAGEGNVISEIDHVMDFIGDSDE